MPLAGSDGARAIRAALGELRAEARALRSRSEASLLKALGSLLGAYSDEHSQARASLAAALEPSSGFSGAVLREGLRLGFRPWTSAAFHELFERELGTPQRSRPPGRAALTTAPREGFECASAFLAGAIPMPALLEVVASLALRTPILIKTAAADRVSAHHFARTLAGVDIPLSRCVRVVDFEGGELDCARAACEADCVVAIGSDASVARVREIAAGAARFVAHGHRLSVCALGPEASAPAALAAWADRIALDVALWDQLGCLSPVAVYAVGGDRDAASRVASALASALAATEARLPRGSVPASALALASHELALAELRATNGSAVEIFRERELRYAVIREADAEARPCPLYRFVRVHPVADARELLSALTPLTRHLAAVACAGFGGEEEAVSARLLALGASRVCAPGELQAPPFAWRRDGLPVLARYARSLPLTPGE
jgi:hypothetical protein